VKENYFSITSFLDPAPNHDNVMIEIGEIFSKKGRVKVENQ